MLLKEMLPALTRVGVLWNPNNASVVLKYKEIETAAKSLNIQVRSMPIREADDIERVLQPAELDNAEAVITTEDALQIAQRSPGNICRPDKVVKGMHITDSFNCRFSRGHIRGVVAERIQQPSINIVVVVWLTDL